MLLCVAIILLLVRRHAARGIALAVVRQDITPAVCP